MGKKIKEADVLREWGSCSTSLFSVLSSVLASVLGARSSFCSLKLFLSLFFCILGSVAFGDTAGSGSFAAPHLLGEILLNAFLRSSALIHRHLQQTTVELQSQ